jgi:hypothetical protein
MSDYARFSHFFFHAMGRMWRIFFGLFAWLVVNAMAIAYLESISFGDALYFTFITGLTIGYGDITPVTTAGRVFAVLTGLVGVMITGLVAAAAVYSLREAFNESAGKK